MKVVTHSNKLKYLSGALGDYVTSANGENASFACPVCAKNPKVKKGKKKLSVSLDTGMYHCWVCEAKGKNIAYFVKSNSASKEAIEGVESCFGKAGKQDKVEDPPLSLPEDFRLLAYSNSMSARIAKKYLYSRGISDEDMQRYKIGISNQRDFINKIIFPSFDKDLNLNFYLSRTYDETQRIKYVNCKANKKDIIFNENMVDFNKELTLTEGVFDALKVNSNVCCMLGSWIDKDYLLFQKIAKHRTPIVLALDPDAIDKAQKIASNFAQFCVEVKILDELERDLGSMTKPEAQNFIINAKHYDNTGRLRYLIKGIKSGSVY